MARLVPLLGLVLTAACGSASPVTFAGDAGSAHDAAQRAGALLDRVYLPGAVRAQAVSVELLGVPGQVVERARSFTVLGQAERIIAGLQAMPPAGLESGTTRDAPSLSSTVLTPAGRSDSGMQVLQVTAGDIGHGRVRVEVQAQVGWVRARTPAETLPAAAPGAQLAIGYGDEPDEALQHKHTLTPAQLSDLAERLNALPTTSPQEYVLCQNPDTALIQLTAQYGGHHVLFDIQVGACDEVDVSVDDVEQPLLGDDGPVVQAVAEILDLQLPAV